MRKPNRDRLADLAGKPADYYARWLTRGLNDYLFGSDTHPPGRSDAFPDAEPFINLGAGLPDELAAIVQVLDATDQAAFKDACAEVMAGILVRNRAVGERDAAIAEHLIVLAAQIEARGVLRHLAGIALCTRGIQGAANLLDFSLSLFGDLASAGVKQDHADLSALIANYQPFPSHLARSALMALVQAAPEALLDHLRLLFWPMEHVYGHNPDMDRRALRRDLILTIARERRTHQALQDSAVCNARLPEEFEAGLQNSILFDWWHLTLISDMTPEMTTLRRNLRLPQPKLTASAMHGDDQPSGWQSPPAPPTSSLSLPQQRAFEQMEYDLSFIRGRLGDPEPRDPELKAA